MDGLWLVVCSKETIITQSHERAMAAWVLRALLRLALLRVSAQSSVRWSLSRLSPLADAARGVGIRSSSFHAMVGWCVRWLCAVVAPLLRLQRVTHRVRGRSYRSKTVLQRWR